MNNRSHSGKSEPFLVPTAVKSIAELDLKHAILPPIAAAMLPPGSQMAIGIGRRQLICVLGSAAVAWPLTARAVKTARIGFLGNPLDNPVTALGYPAFLDELKKSGFSVGQNLAIEAIDIYQDTPRFFAETADLVRSNVELLFVIGGEIVLQAAVAASRTVPIVMWAINFDPIARGYVKSLAQPGGNITGIVSLQTELAAKQVELLTQALPDRTRLAVLWDAISADQFTAAERQARSLRLEVQSLKLENPPYDFDAAFRSLAKGSPQMLLVLSSQFFGAGDPAAAPHHVHL